MPVRLARATTEKLVIRIEVVASDAPRIFVLFHLPNAPFVALLARKFGREENFNDLQGFFDRVLTAADGDNVCVVMLASQCGRLVIPCKGRANTPNFISGHLLTISRASEDDTEGIEPAFPVGANTQSRINAETRVIIERVVFPRSVVHEIVSEARQRFDEEAARFEPCMIGGYMYTHVGIRPQRIDADIVWVIQAYRLL